MRANNRTERMMRKAVQLSRRGFPGFGAHVGCVIARGEEVVGTGHYRYQGEPHAEVVALQMAGAKAKGAEVFVSLEPCNHYGRTGPCTEALIAAEVGRVYFACHDPNPVAAGGAKRLEDAGIPVESGLLQEEAREANLRFLRSHELKRPYIVLKAAASLDGRIALPSGESKWITSEASRRVGHRLRADMGAVLVGSGTVLADDPELTARLPGVMHQPLRIVLDPEVRLDGTQRVFREGGETIHVVGQGRGGSANRLELPAEHDTFDLGALAAELWKRGVNGILVEGGPTTISSFVKQGLFDRIELFLAPKLLGSGFSWLCDYGLADLASAVQLSDLRVSKVGGDLRITADAPTRNSNP